MTKFNKDQFIIETGYKGYTTYCMVPMPCPWDQRKFVARHRVGGAKGFANFIAKNFTVEEYFGRLEAGESPLAIVGSKGYIQPHVKKWMKAAGYTKFTAETKEHWFQNVYRKSFEKKVA
jgi:hypothetical protein